MNRQRRATGSRLARHEAIELAAVALEALDTGVVVVDAAAERILQLNRAAQELLEPWLEREAGLPRPIADAAATLLQARRHDRRLPPAARLELGEQTIYMRLMADTGLGVEVLTLRAEIMRDPALFRELESRYGVSRREFQVLARLRLGETNRQIATAMGVAESTVAGFMRRLLERFDVPNRTKLVDLVERTASRRA